MEQFTTMSQKTSLEKIDQFSSNPIRSGLDTFEFFKRNWDEKDLVTKRGTKVLFLDDENIPTWYGDVKGLQKFPLDNKNQYPNINATEIFQQASQKNISKIILANNSPFHLQEDNDKTDRILKQFQDTAQSFPVSLEDYIILSPHGYFSYKENDFKKAPVLEMES